MVMDVRGLKGGWLALALALARVRVYWMMTSRGPGKSAGEVVLVWGAALVCWRRRRESARMMRIAFERNGGVRVKGEDVARNDGISSVNASK